MEVAELLRKVRRIEIKARGLSRELFSGQYHSAFKGRGMLFSEVREYRYGDDIRNIEWNVTARFGNPYVKVFDEEREMTVMLVCDISGSENFASQGTLKRDLITEICAIMAFSAIQNNDKVGLVLFTDRIELFIPPRKGKTHVLRIIRDLLEFQPVSSRTDLNVALKFLTNAIRKRCTTFLMSDFRGQPFLDALKIASRKHDMIGLRFTDPMELELPVAGLYKITDLETGEVRWLDAASRKVRTAYRAATSEQEAAILQSLKRSGIDHATIFTDRSYIQPLNRMFKAREVRR